MLANSEVPGGDADKFDDAISCYRNSGEQESSEPRQDATGACQELQVAPRIEILFDRHQEHILRATTPAELSAIGVLFPPNIPQQRAINRAKRDEITTAAMIRPQDKLLRHQPGERIFDIAPAQARAIAPDCDHLVITELRNGLDRVLEPRGKTPAGLAMDK